MSVNLQYRLREGALSSGRSSGSLTAFFLMLLMVAVFGLPREAEASVHVLVWALPQAAPTAQMKDPMDADEDKPAPPDAGPSKKGVGKDNPPPEDKSPKDVAPPSGPGKVVDTPVPPPADDGKGGGDKKGGGDRGNGKAAPPPPAIGGAAGAEKAVKGDGKGTPPPPGGNPPTGPDGGPAAPGGAAEGKGGPAAPGGAAEGKGGPAAPGGSAKPAEAGGATTAVSGTTSPSTKDVKSISSRLEWRERFTWLSLAFFALALLFYLLHLLLPFQALSVLGRIGHLFVWLGTGSLALTMLIISVCGMRPPGAVADTGPIWFALVAAGAYIAFRKRMKTVNIAGLFLSLVVVAALGMSLQLLPTLGGSPAGLGLVRSEFGWLGAISYGALALFAVAGVFQTSSSWLGFLARRSRGTGYGLSPELWDEYKVLPRQALYVAFPALTLSVLALFAWSIGSTGDPFAGWYLNYRSITVLFAWFFSLGAMLAFRDLSGRRRLAPLLLFLGVLLTGALFVGYRFVVTFLHA